MFFFHPVHVGWNRSQRRSRTRILIVMWLRYILKLCGSLCPGDVALAVRCGSLL
jgi:hypothetical protein